MSHVHYGVDNTGNTRVWECSTILAHLVTCQSPLLLPSSSMPSTSSKSSTPLSTLSSNNCDNIPLPFIGLSNMISLARPRPSAHPYQNAKNTIPNENTIPNTMQQKKYQENDSSPPLNNRLRIIELGSGMAALPSLSLAAVAMNNHINTNISSNTNTGTNTSTRTTDVPFMDIVITDGHPKSVENNSICSKLTHDLYYSNDNKDDNNNKEKEVEDKECKKQNLSSELCCYCCSIQTKLLLWKANEEGMKECQALLKKKKKNNNNNNDHNSDSNSDTEPNYFDVVLVSDCTHFIEFHSGLIATIGRLLRVGGVCILCQPKRGKSLDQFIELIHTMNHSCNRDGDGDVNVHKNDNDTCTHNDIATAATATATATPTKRLFELNLYNDYNERISNQHKDYLERKDDTYDENIHYPLILILRKLREYNEDIDTKIALHHVEQRDAGRI
jgi:SAM-dependent methyltransferase